MTVGAWAAVTAVVLLPFSVLDEDGDYCVLASRTSARLAEAKGTVEA